MLRHLLVSTLTVAFLVTVFVSVDKYIEEEVVIGVSSSRAARVFPGIKVCWYSDTNGSFEEIVLNASFTLGNST